MRFLCLLSCMLAVLGVSQAHANTVFSWAYDAQLGAGTGSGSLTTDSAGVVIAIDGSFDGLAITGILPYDPFYVNDNTLFYPATPLVDYGGLLFQLADSSRVNLYYFTDAYQDERDLPSGGFEAGSGVFAVTPQVAATPLPATLPLFASGLAVMGLLGWRRKRHAGPAAPAQA